MAPKAVQELEVATPNFSEEETLRVRVRILGNVHSFPTRRPSTVRQIKDEIVKRRLISIKREDSVFLLSKSGFRMPEENSIDHDRVDLTCTVSHTDPAANAARDREELAVTEIHRGARLKGTTASSSTDPEQCGLPVARQGSGFSQMVEHMLKSTTVPSASGLSLVDEDTQSPDSEDALPRCSRCGKERSLKNRTVIAFDGSVGCQECTVVDEGMSLKGKKTGAKPKKSVKTADKDQLLGLTVGERNRYLKLQAEATRSTQPDATDGSRQVWEIIIDMEEILNRRTRREDGMDNDSDSNHIHSDDDFHFNLPDNPTATSSLPSSSPEPCGLQVAHQDPPPSSSLPSSVLEPCGLQVAHQPTHSLPRPPPLARSSTCL